MFEHSPSLDSLGLSVHGVVSHRVGGFLHRTASQNEALESLKSRFLTRAFRLELRARSLLSARC